MRLIGALITPPFLILHPLIALYTEWNSRYVVKGVASQFGTNNFQMCFYVTLKFELGHVIGISLSLIPIPPMCGL